MAAARASSAAVASVAAWRAVLPQKAADDGHRPSRHGVIGIDARRSGTVSLTYSDAAGIDLTAGQVTLLFANPEKSGWDATVCLVVGEREAARSDLLAPGEQVTQLALLDGAEKDLTAGSCSGTLKVSFYHPQTGAKAMLDAEIPVTVTVTADPRTDDIGNARTIFQEG